ncbi:MAG: hypothetical protein KC621_15340 [Myxococcales bacterium]|nr:hypothetical protein [Myxococcales bacterium]
MIRAVLVLLALDFALSAPMAAAEGGWTALTLVGDLALIASVTLLHERWGPRLATGAWSLLWVYQCIRLASTLAMGEEGLVYDLWQLSFHTWVLVRDLVGGWVWGIAAAIVLLVVGVTALVGLVMPWVREALADRRLLAGVWVVALLGVLPHAPVSYVAPALVANLEASVDAWSETQSILERARAADPGPATGEHPDLHVYIIESYGAVLLRDPLHAKEMRPALREVRDAVVPAGWSMASGFSRAPVSGGRSWIADGAVLMGTPVAHESTFQQVSGHADELVTLPAWAKREGWHTIVCRPKDRERPGVPHDNRFGFDRTVFYEDLDYHGLAYGWGWVPDQYTLGHLREHALADAPGPVVLFAHLASSHVPWWDPPPIYSDWHRLGVGGEDEELPDDRDLTEELGFDTHRFRRGERGVGPDLRQHLQTGDSRARYRGMVLYDVEVLTDHLLKLGTDRPALVLWMGDHQPPGIAPRKDFDVPVHLFANDPALLRPFLEQGFVRGPWPVGRAVVGHEDLYGLLAASLGAVPSP